MTSADIITLLETECGPRIKAKNVAVIDPFVVVEPSDLPAVCKVLRDHPRLMFDMLNCVSGVDYLEMDPKKVAKAGSNADSNRARSRWIRKDRLVGVGMLIQN